MKKKVLSMMLAGAMTVSMLAGCGAGSDETATTDNTAADTKTETAGTTEAGGGTAEASGNISNVRRVDVLPYHSLGVYKWDELGIPYRWG